MNKMSKSIDLNIETVTTIYGVTCRVSQNPLGGVYIFIHDVPEEALKKVTKILGKTLEHAGTTTYVGCSKARDGTKLYFVEE